MKLKHEMVEYLGRQIVQGLVDRELIDTEDHDREVSDGIANVIVGDLRVEDDLNEEVKGILEEMGEEIENVDYRKMFNMVKQKLSRERGLIL